MRYRRLGASELVVSRPSLGDKQFATHITDVICGVIEAPSAVLRGRSEPAARRGETSGRVDVSHNGCESPRKVR